MKYITRCLEGTKVVSNHKISIKFGGIKTVINEQCLNHLSTFKGREKAAQIKLKQTQLLPIFINQNILLFPSKSIRNMDAHYINYHEVLSVSKKCFDTEIIFKDLSTLMLDVSYKKIKNQMSKAKKLIYENDCV